MLTEGIIDAMENADIYYVLIGKLLKTPSDISGSLSGSSMEEDKESSTEKKN